MFKQLSDEIYPILQSYLIHDDYHCFVNSSKRDFYEIKRKTVYWKLSSKYSMMFLRNEKNFQQQINGMVADPTKQISIDLDLAEETVLMSLVDLRVHRIMAQIDNLIIPSFPFLPSVTEIDLFFRSGNINNLSSLNHLQRVGIDSLSEHPAIDISPLRDVPEVSLANLSNIQECRILGKQRKLHITCCDQLINVRNFSNIIELSFCCCELLTDISPLNNIPILSFTLCPSIRDLTPLLGNHKRLTIINCNYELEGYEILQNIPIVYLDYCNISDLRVLRAAKSVTLHRCNELVDVSPLSNVKRVELSECEKIADISALALVSELLLANLTAIHNAQLLRNRHLTVNVWDSSFSNLLVASNLRSLGLSRQSVKDLGNVSRFSNLQYLCLVYVSVDFSTKGFADIPVIELRACEELSDISGLGRNREVRLIYCPLIRDVSNLRNVPVVTIRFCQGIEDYLCLSTVPRLKIFN